ncbi:MAG: DNA polymerase III subunit chi [Burkholderiales bacterium]
MTRVDFYTDATDKAEVACRLAGKAMQQKLRVLIVAPAQDQLQRVNRMLWTHPPIGFVPHCLAHEPIAADTPVLLSHSADDPPHDQVLINLGDEWPSSFARFARLVEIVSNDEEDKRHARERFRFYRDRGYQMHTHKLATDARSAP